MSGSLDQKAPSLGIAATVTRVAYPDSLMPADVVRDHRTPADAFGVSADAGQHGRPEQRDGDRGAAGTVGCPVRILGRRQVLVLPA